MIINESFNLHQSALAHHLLYYVFLITHIAPYINYGSIYNIFFSDRGGLARRVEFQDGPKLFLADIFELKPAWVRAEPTR